MGARVGGDLNSEPGTSKRTEARETVALLALEAGMSRAAAAAKAGIHRNTFYDWISHDPSFRERVEQAEDAAEAFYAAVVKDAAPKSWQAAAWWLEHGPRKKRYAALKGDQVWVETPEGVAAAMAETPVEEVVERVSIVLDVLAGAGVSVAGGGRQTDPPPDAVHTAPTNGKANGLSAPK